MPPSASLLFPTRRRREYLAVALASVAPQAAALGAEIVVVEDDPADPETERIVTGHGGRYLAHGEPRGINVARNAAIDAASGELLCLLDDDVEAWPGYLEAMLSAAAAHPGHEAFGGPIRPRLEGAACARAAASRCRSPRSTSGPEDRDAEFAWGANLALRRSALERIGRFDPALGGAGRRGGLAAAAARRGRADPLRRRGRASTTAARAPTRACGRSRGRRSTAAAPRAATTPSRASSRRSPPSCARWRAASGTSPAAAAGSGSS